MSLFAFEVFASCAINVSFACPPFLKREEIGITFGLQMVFLWLFSLMWNGVMKMFELSICLVTDDRFCIRYLKYTWTVFWMTAMSWMTVLRSSQISPEELLLTLNSINPSIQFIMEYSKDQIPFLVILMKRNENDIWMDLYYKPTDTLKCLPFTSSQSNHCKRNIPFYLARKICTIAKIGQSIWGWTSHKLLQSWI